MKVDVQKIRKKTESDIDKAVRYYSVIFALNNIKIPRKQLCLLAFTAVRGSITSPAARQEFIKLFKSSLASLENMKQELVKAGWLVQIDMKYRANPKVALDFSKDIMLQINLVGDDKSE